MITCTQHTRWVLHLTADCSRVPDAHGVGIGYDVDVSTGQPWPPSLEDLCHALRGVVESLWINLLFADSAGPEVEWRVKLLADDVDVVAPL